MELFYMRKFENYSRNLAVLKTADRQDLSNEFVISGIIDKFFLQEYLPAFEMLESSIRKRYEDVLDSME